MPNNSFELQQAFDYLSDLPFSEKIPAVFVGHGDPRHALRDNSFTRTLTSMGSELRERFHPEAILVVSAHWMTTQPLVCVQRSPQVIYDFQGFPDEMYAIEYSAPGAPELANRIADAIPSVSATSEWGLDHGAWTVLKHMIPSADIPVFQLSIDIRRPMPFHFELAKQLSCLRDHGVLILGSGNIVHNLRVSIPKLFSDENSPQSLAPEDWAVEFDEWVKSRLIVRDFESLQNYMSQGKSAALSVPTPDHYIPMMYTLGVVSEKDTLFHDYEMVSHGAMSMRTFRFG